MNNCNSSKEKEKDKNSGEQNTMKLIKITLFSKNKWSFYKLD